MKTITANYRWPDGAEAQARTELKSTHSVALIRWEGSTDRFIAAHGELLTTADAMTVQRDLRQRGATAGAEVKITEEGEWEVFTE